MKKYKLVLANSFKKDYKLIKRRNYDINVLDKVVELLLSDTTLPEKYCDHQLKRKTKKIQGTAHSAGLDSGLHKEQDRADSYAFKNRNSR